MEAVFPSEGFPSRPAPPELFMVALMHPISVSESTPHQGNLWVTKNTGSSMYAWLSKLESVRVGVYYLERNNEKFLFYFFLSFPL